MAGEGDPATVFTGDRHLFVRRLIGRLFEGVLILSTLIGVVALGLLFVLIGRDALGLGAANPAWFLVYLGAVVGPVSAYTLYVRRRPAVASVNATTFLVVGGTFLASVTSYAMALALGPWDVVVGLGFVVCPPVAILTYERTVRPTRWTGPAVPASIVVGVLAWQWLYPFTAPIVARLADWVLLFLIVTVPVAAGVGLLTDRRADRRTAMLAAGLVGLGGLLGGSGGLATGTDPGLWVVVISGFVVPTGLFAVATIRRHPDGRLGLLGPVILVGGLAIGVALERSLGIQGIDTWLNWTLLLESWSDFRPEQAGIYPQLLGSIMVVVLMTLLAFPLGVGAAVYLEEYAPETGWLGRLAAALDVNISNLAGVPSVVYGLLGLALFRQMFGLTPGILLAAAVTLGLLILPIVIVAAQEALRSVPDEYRRGSYGLGASRWQTIRNVVLPEALPGILTGTILAIGRAIGETAPLVMLAIATTRFSPPSGLFSGATALPLQIFAARGNNIPEFRTGVVAAASIVLLALMVLMNATAILVRNRYQRD